jgi:predicted PurR-regulated permease PerM
MDAPTTLRPAPQQAMRRLLLAGGVAVVLVLAYLLRGVLAPLFLAFMLAYALDPLVKRLQRARVPRSVGAPLVLLALLAVVVATIFIGVPRLVDEFADAARKLPEQLGNLYVRTEVFLRDGFHYRMPATWGELVTNYGAVIADHAPDAARVGSALFGTFSAIFVLLGTLIVPIFALYLLGDFDRIIARTALLVPRRFAPAVTSVALEIHSTLGRYVRGQVITSLVLSALYAGGLELVGIRLAVPIGVLTGLLAFIPYLGLALGTTLAVLVAVLDFHSTGQVVAVCLMMGTVGVLDGMVVTPRIVGGSVGLRPLEVLVTMMAAATLFGFLGVLLAVPLGAVTKILLRRAVDAYLVSEFYRAPPAPPISRTPIPVDRPAVDFDRPSLDPLALSEAIAFRAPEPSSVQPVEAAGEFAIERATRRG